jgi:leader peptidase (prepilin peptidase)/N-methyltransferase
MSSSGGCPAAARWCALPLPVWVALHGRCRYCGSPISIRYPVVESGTALVYVLLTAGYGLTPWVLPVLALATLLIPAGLIARDASKTSPRGMRVPYRLVAAVSAAALAWLVIRPWLAFLW